MVLQGSSAAHYSASADLCIDYTDSSTLPSQLPVRDIDTISNEEDEEDEEDEEEEDEEDEDEEAYTAEDSTYCADDDNTSITSRQERYV